MSALTAQLWDGAAVLGVPLDDGQLTKFETLVAELLRWNKAYNLTAITQPAEILTHHLLDSLSAQPDLAGGRRVGEAARAQDGPVQVPGAQIDLGGGLRRDVGRPDLIGAGPWRLARSHRGDLHEPADPGPLGGVGHQHGGGPVDGVLARGATARAGACREYHRVSP